MFIKSVEISNFTVFEHMNCDFSSGINIFIGENGTGKTHLLKILYAVSNTEKYKISLIGANEFEGEPVSITNNLDHIIYHLFNAPVEGLDVNLVRNNSTNHESARIKITTDSENIISYISELGFMTAINLHDIDARIFEQEALFIPAKDMLSHSGLENDYAKRLLPFDRTQIDILNNLKISKLREQTTLSKSLTEKLSKVMGGTVLYKNGGYYILKSGSDSLVNISLEAEGFKKLAVIYRAIDTGYLQPGSMLFWDEPEANINPKLIPIIVDIILELSRNKVQIFIATHDYFLSQYFEVLAKDSDNTAFHSLYKTDNGVKCESSDKFSTLNNNDIIEEKIRLYDTEIAKVLG